jgi:cell division protease FtsH
VANALIKSGDQTANPLIVALNAGMVTASKLLLKKRVAYHEAGHAVILKVLRPEIGIAEVTIVERGDSDGCVSYEKTSPYFQTPLSRESVLDQVCVSLAGRVAEQRKYGHNEVDAGATSDLANATEMVWDAITRFGLDFEFGPVNLAALTKAGPMSSGWLFDQAQRRLQEILKAGLERTEGLVNDQWHKVEAVAQILFEKKKLTEDELLNVMELSADALSQAHTIPVAQAPIAKSA